MENQARQKVKAEKAEENEGATESENTPSSVEEIRESESKSESGNDSDESNPFARRTANRFNPSSITTGNLLNIIS